MILKRMKVLVTGGTGFIGSHTVVQLITSGYNVVVVDDLSNSRAEVIDAIEEITGIRPVFEIHDLCHFEGTKRIFEKHHPDAVIHFAAKKLVGESVERPLLYYRVNLESMLNVIDAAFAFGCNKIVFSSSCTVYGQPDSNPVNENAPLKKAESPYGNTKQICEEILSDASNSSQLNVVSLRYFNPVGAHESALIGEYPLGAPSNLMPVLTQAAIGKRASFHIFGSDYNTPDGTCIRDYIHVVDLAEAHVAAISYMTALTGNGNFRAFNIGTGHGVSVKEMVETFERINNLKLSYTISGRRPGDVEQVWADNRLATEELKWVPRLGLESMVSSAWKWEIHLSRETKQNV